MGHLVKILFKDKSILDISPSDIDQLKSADRYLKLFPDEVKIGNNFETLSEISWDLAAMGFDGIANLDNFLKNTTPDQLTSLSNAVKSFKGGQEYWNTTTDKGVGYAVFAHKQLTSSQNTLEALEKMPEIYQSHFLVNTLKDKYNLPQERVEVLQKDPQVSKLVETLKAKLNESNLDYLDEFCIKQQLQNGPVERIIENFTALQQAIPQFANLQAAYQKEGLGELFKSKVTKAMTELDKNLVLNHENILKDLKADLEVYTLSRKFDIPENKQASLKKIVLQVSFPLVQENIQELNNALMAAGFGELAKKVLHIQLITQTDAVDIGVSVSALKNKLYDLIRLKKINDELQQPEDVFVERLTSQIVKLEEISNKSLEDVVSKQSKKFIKNMMWPIGDKFGPALKIQATGWISARIMKRDNISPSKQANEFQELLKSEGFQSKLTILEKIKSQEKDLSSSQFNEILEKHLSSNNDFLIKIDDEKTQKAFKRALNIKVNALAFENLESEHGKLFTALAKSFIGNKDCAALGKGELRYDALPFFKEYATAEEQLNVMSSSLHSTFTHLSPSDIQKALADPKLEGKPVKERLASLKMLNDWAGRLSAKKGHSVEELSFIKEFVSSLLPEYLTTKDLNALETKVRILYNFAIKLKKEGKYERSTVLAGIRSYLEEQHHQREDKSKTPAQTLARTVDDMTSLGIVKKNVMADINKHMLQEFCRSEMRKAVEGAKSEYSSQHEQFIDIFITKLANSRELLRNHNEIKNYLTILIQTGIKIMEEYKLHPSVAVTQFLSAAADHGTIVSFDLKMIDTNVRNKDYKKNLETILDGVIKTIGEKPTVTYKDLAKNIRERPADSVGVLVKKVVQGLLPYNERHKAEKLNRPLGTLVEAIKKSKYGVSIDKLIDMALKPKPLAAPQLIEGEEAGRVPKKPPSNLANAAKTALSFVETFLGAIPIGEANPSIKSDLLEKNESIFKGDAEKIRGLMGVDDLVNLEQPPTTVAQFVIPPLMNQIRKARLEKKQAKEVAESTALKLEENLKQIRILKKKDKTITTKQVKEAEKSAKAARALANKGGELSNEASSFTKISIGALPKVLKLLDEYKGKEAVQKGLEYAIKALANPVTKWITTKAIDAALKKYVPDLSSEERDIIVASLPAVLDVIKALNITSEANWNHLDKYINLARDLNKAVNGEILPDEETFYKDFAAQFMDHLSLLGEDLILGGDVLVEGLKAVAFMPREGKGE